ncbi:MAG: ATP-binding cassette domain-containing protein, partial [Umezawaea sp.]
IFAVVGPSGAGKTTLLSRFVTPEARGALADAHVFHTTVRANVLFAGPDATQEELDHAARVADLDLDWDTVVGEHGTAISGGQRQRLVLARAVLAAAPVLLLDEPVEGLDPDHADRVLGAVLAAARGAVVLVTHRLSPLAHEHFDEILVLEAGAITQRGSHAELVAVPGYYRDRWEDESLTRARAAPA